MWPPVIVKPQPFGCIVLHFFEAFEHVLTEPAVADSPVGPFDVRVLLRLAWLDILNPDLMLVRPTYKLVTDELGSIIATNRQRLASPLQQLVKRPDDPQCRQGKASLYRQSLTFKVVYDVEYSEAAPIRKLIVHEIHRPHLIRSDRLL